MTNRDENDKKIVLTAERLRAWAYSHMNLQLVEDFVQDCAILWFEGRSVGVPFQYLLTDYLRSNGHKNKKGNIPDDAMRSAIHGIKFEKLNSPYKLEKKKQDPRVAKLLKVLDRDQRIVVILMFCWDFTQREVAHVLGVDEARVSQILKKIRLKAKK